jgi:hypothetical protein
VGVDVTINRPQLGHSPRNSTPPLLLVYIYIYNVPKGPAKIVKRCNDKLTRGGVKVGFGALAGYLE